MSASPKGRRSSPTASSRSRSRRRTQMSEGGRPRQATIGLISNPNNPGGNLLVDATTLDALLDGLPDCLWIIDEAFADYTRVTFVPWGAERRNLGVVRTLSKAYGLAGLRVGYAATHVAGAEPVAPRP